MTYAGFPRRALALLIDFIVLLPLVAFHTFLAAHSPHALVAASIVVGAVASGYAVYFLARWGQTLGKMAACIKVVRLDGTPIAWFEALRRASVDIGLWLMYVIGLAYTVSTWEDPPWSSLDADERQRLLAARNPIIWAYDFVVDLWTGSELVVLLLNEKRRALHDFIAGTVVIVLPMTPQARRR